VLTMSNSHASLFLPLPVLTGRVGVRGNFQSSDSRKRPLTRPRLRFGLPLPARGERENNSHASLLSSCPGLTRASISFDGLPDQVRQRRRKNVKQPSVSGPCFCQATGAPVVPRLRGDKPSSLMPRERSAVRRTVKVSAPWPKGLRSLSARAACAGEPCCEQGPSRTPNGAPLAAVLGPGTAPMRHRLGLSPIPQAFACVRPILSATYGEPS
jgi:hypothetical protein